MPNLSQISGVSWSDLSSVMGLTKSLISQVSGISVPANQLSDVSISLNSYTFDENSAAFTFTITRTGNLSSVCQVDYIVAGYGAAPVDSNDILSPSFNTNITQVFTANQTQHEVNVSINPDYEVEPSEQFSVTLLNASNCTIGTSQVVGTIVNDDTYAEVSITMTPAQAYENNATFTVNISRGVNTNTSCSVAWDISGYGTDPLDVNTEIIGSLTGTADFPNGVTFTQFTIGVSDDSTLEHDESFVVTLSSPNNCTIGTSTAVGVVVNDEPVYLYYLDHGGSTEPRPYGQDANNQIAVYTNVNITNSGVSGNFYTDDLCTTEFSPQYTYYELYDEGGYREMFVTMNGSSFNLTDTTRDVFWQANPQNMLSGFNPNDKDLACAMLQNPPFYARYDVPQVGDELYSDRTINTLVTQEGFYSNGQSRWVVNGNGQITDGPHDC